MELGTLDWAGIGALLLAFATIWKALRETPKDIEKVEAETTDKYVEIANKSADLLSYHLGRNAALRDELEQMKQKYETVQCNDTSLRHGIDVLHKQIENLGKEPEWYPSE